MSAVILKIPRINIEKALENQKPVDGPTPRPERKDIRVPVKKSPSSRAKRA